MNILEHHSLKTIAQLSLEHKEMLSQGYIQSKYSTKATQLLASIWQQKTYLECDCTPNTRTPPVLGVRQLGHDKYILANLPNRDAHADSCPFSYSHCEYKQAEKSYEPVVHENEHGYLSVLHEGIKELYRTLIHNSGMNIVSPTSWAPERIESHLIDGARLSFAMTQNQIAKRILYGYQSFKRSEDALRDSPHGDYRICFNLISEFDNRSINLSFKKEKSFWYDAGTIYCDSHTNKGPFMATTVMSKHKNSVITLASHIQPVLSRWIPLPIYSNDHRLLAFELIGKSGLLLTPEFMDLNCSLVFNLYPMPSHENDQITLNPDFILKTPYCNFLFAHPDKTSRQIYENEGQLIWFRSFSFLEGKRNSELSRMMSSIKSRIGDYD